MEKVLGKIPENPTPSQVEIDHKKLLETFEEVFNHSELETMDHPTMQIRLKPAAAPFSLSVRLKITYSDPGKRSKCQVYGRPKYLICKKVEEGELSEWCHRMICVKKPNGHVRIAVDLTPLNPLVVRPLHSLKTLT